MPRNVGEGVTRGNSGAGSATMRPMIQTQRNKLRDSRNRDQARAERTPLRDAKAIRAALAARARVGRPLDVEVQPQAAPAACLRGPAGKPQRAGARGRDSGRSHQLGV